MTERAKCGGRGFTLVEVMVAMTAAAVLALTMGALLVTSSRAWHDHWLIATMQGDASTAVAMIDAWVREAHPADITEPLAGSTSSRLTVGYRSIYRGTVSNIYNAAGATLFLDPDTRTSGNEVKLSSCKVKYFTCSNATDFVSFRVALEASGETIDVSGQSYERN